MDDVQLITNVVSWIIEECERHPEKMGDVTCSANVALMFREIGIHQADPFLAGVLKVVDACDHTIDPHWTPLKCLVYSMLKIKQSFIKESISRLSFIKHRPDPLSLSIMCTAMANYPDIVSTDMLCEAKNWLSKDIEKRIKEGDSLNLSFELVSYAKLVGKDENLLKWINALKQMQKGDYWEKVSGAWTEVWVTAACVYNLALLGEVDSEEVQRAIRWLKRQRSADGYWENMRVTSLVVRALLAVNYDKKEEIKKRVSTAIVKAKFPIGRIFKEQKERETRAKQIQFNITTANTLFRRRTIASAKLLREDVPRLFTELAIPCKGLDDFTVKIQSLASLFEVELDPLRALIVSPDRNLGSIKLIEKWLEQKGVSNYRNIIDVWKNINRLRRNPPTHAKMSTNTVEAVNFFNCTFPINFSQLWDNVLKRFLESLLKFQEVLTENP